MVEANYLVASDGSDTTELVCRALLELRADDLIGGESFKTMGAMAISAETSVHLVDDTIIQTQFRAHKVGLTEDKSELVVRYEVVVGFVRPRRLEELWPEDNNTGMGEDDDDEDEDEPSFGGLGLRDNEGNPNEVNFMKDDTEYVREVWEYGVDDQACRPVKEVTYEYYRPGHDEPFHIIRLANLKSGDLILDEDVEIDTAHQINEMLFRRSFSAEDIEIIQAVCDSDYMRIADMIWEAGGWEGTNHKPDEDEPDDPEIEVDTIDDSDDPETSD